VQFAAELTDDGESSWDADTTSMSFAISGRDDVSLTLDVVSQIDDAIDNDSQATFEYELLYADSDTKGSNSLVSSVSFSVSGVDAPEYEISVDDQGEADISRDGIDTASGIATYSIDLTCTAESDVEDSCGNASSGSSGNLAYHWADTDEISSIDLDTLDGESLVYSAVDDSDSDVDSHDLDALEFALDTDGALHSEIGNQYYLILRMQSGDLNSYRVFTIEIE